MLSAGDQFDRYVIEGVLGQGGMGIVYRALDPKLGRRVALKVVLLGKAGSTPDAAARLVREARAAAAFDHPNAVSIFDVGEVDGAPYLAMELVAGKTLRAFVGDGSATAATRLAWLADVARALAAGHRAGLVHRDVKPENVMVRDDGVVKVLDFGIARRALGKVDPTAPTAQELATITAEGVAVGTPLYMAPEQLRGARVDGRSDQFSWGVVAYELLTGKSPWAAAGDLLALAAAIAGDEADARPMTTTGVSAAASAVVMRALKKSPADRFDSMEEIVDALDAARTGVAPSAPVPRARRMVWGLAAAGAIVLALGMAALVRSRGGAESAAAVDAGPRAEVRASAIGTPLPTRGKPEAIEAYREALAAYRDGLGERTTALLHRAVALDPTLAEASIRLAISGNEGPRSVQDLLARAATYRDTLAPRDRAILAAGEALYARDPEDAATFARVLLEAAAQAPTDVDLQALAGTSARFAGDLDAASRQVDRVLALDPGFARALYERSEIAAERGGDAAARQAAEECVARFPRATRCVALLARADIVEGRCAAVEEEARREHVIEPDAPIPFATLASALMAEGRPRESVEEALAQRLERTPTDERDEVELAMGWQIEVTYGRFAVADEMVRKLVAKKPADLRLGAMAWFRRLAIAYEAGDPGAAVIARDALARTATWDALGRKATGQLLALALKVGAIDRATFNREIATWRSDVEVMTPDGGDAADLGAMALWVSRYADVAVAPQDFDEALRRYDAARLASVPLEFVTGAWGPVGRVLLHGGRARDALPYLQRAAAYCGFVSAPDDIIHSTLDLGEALEATGDAPGACAAYARVLFYWGSAPRSITAAEARGRSKKLACAKN